MKIYTDGARDENVIGLGWVLDWDEGWVRDNRYMIGTFTSMEAEYYALLDGLRHAYYQTNEPIVVYIDCEPIIDKMRIPDAYSNTWYDRRQGCHRLLNKFEDWEMEWIPRAKNTNANRMAYEALEAGRAEIR